MVMIRDFNGKLNLDVHPFRVPKGDFVDALNITRDAVSAGSDMVVSNIVGNQLVAYNGYQANTTNIVIGAYNDDLKNRVIYFVWNNQGYHSILLFDATARTITKILQSKTDSGGIDILNFQLLYKVNSVNILHRDTDGDLLYWNDAYNRPGQLNIDDFVAGLYGSTVTDDLIRLNRVPPLLIPIPSYQSDTNNTVNNLKKKLFEFAYAWVYKNGEMSTISPVSKVILPVNAYNVSTDSDPTQNNVINIQVFAGGQDFQSIQILGRQSLGTTYSNWFVIDTLDRDDYSITPYGAYTYTFLNDGQYIDADQNFTSLLFSNCADQCNAQTFVNGNVVIQGAITEGYDLIKRTAISVQITASLVDTQGSTLPPSNPTVTIFALNDTFVIFQIGTSVAEGDFFRIKFNFQSTFFTDPETIWLVDVSYTASAGDTDATVANYFVSAIQAQASAQFSHVNTDHGTGGGFAPNNIAFEITTGGGGTRHYTNFVLEADPPATQVGGSATYKWNEKIRFGLVYKDKYGKSNGVVSFVTTDLDPTDFSVTMPDFNFNNTVGSPYYGNPQIPEVSASISHLPPSWAVAYEWVRTTNQAVSSFLQYITAEVKQLGGFYYFCIENLNVFKTDNSGFVPSYTFQSGDRIRILATLTSSSVAPFYTLPTTVQDYEILGTVQMEMTGGTTMGEYLKVAVPTPAITYGPNILVEIYSPSQRSDNTEQVFFSFGETYNIYTGSDGIRYHSGQQQNQTASQPATFIFPDGDVYYKFRNFYKLNTATGQPTSGQIDPSTIYTKGIMDANYNDYWASAVNSDGQPWVIDPNAKRIFDPVEIRFGQAYQPGTDINGLNIFYPNDFIEVFRDYGAIQAFTIRDKFARVYQQLRCGMIPIYSQILKDQSGSNSVVVSDTLLNPVQYYEGQFGCGDHPESIAYNNYADYFASNMRTIIGRLSQDGLQPISIQNEINNFCVTELGQRDFNYKAYGVFDAYNNLYILAMEATPNSTAKTIVWNEQRNGFETFLSYAPEMMTCLRQLLITFKNGQLYTHDSSTYNNFYGTQYDSSITAVFNDNAIEKKSWMNVSELASSVWDIPVINTNVVTNGLQQQSTLLESDFTYLEGQYDASLKRDINTNVPSNPRINGDVLKGSYAIMQFHKTQPTGFEFLNIVKVGTIDSPLTTRQ